MRALTGIACFLLAISLAAPGLAKAAALPAIADAVPAYAASGTGGVAVNGSSAATNDPQVVVTVPPPAGSAGVLRLSNDGGTTWVELLWATAVAWSLIDPAAGGSDTDGTKTVTVQGGDGLGAWAPIGSASILLDRTGPEITNVEFDGAGDPVGYYRIDATDAGVGVARSEVSLDGVHWLALQPHPYTFWPGGYFDFRDGTIGGSWALGHRDVYGRVVDNVGNMTTAPLQSGLITSLRTGSVDEIPADFSMPLPAVTNQPYTIAPTFDPSFTVPAGAHCQWHLVWGDMDARLEAGVNPTYGEVTFTVPPTNGVCTPWTFTLPYASTLEYTWQLAISGVTDPSEWLAFTSPLAGSFRAAQDGTFRGITTSNLPLYYVLPDRDLVGLTGTVTYRLYRAGGAPYRDGAWVCHPASDPNDRSTQSGGSAFACPVTSAGPWVAQWTKVIGAYRWLAGYDPLGDRSRPVMSSLRATPAPGSGLGTTEMVHFTWGGSDKGTGIRSYTLQVSKNGGGWSTLALSSPLARSADRGLAIGASYRFRVRATDRAGNVGYWRYTATFRPTRYDDLASVATWSSGWTTPSWTGAQAGHVHAASAAGRAVTFKVTCLAVGVIAPRGPGLGWVRIYVDGVLASTIDLHAGTNQPPTVVWQRSWTSAAAHTIRVVNLATSGHQDIAIDGLATLR